ncbi:glycosyltransferase family 2 protein [Marisediminicola senii]|uniref:glycosyltransferase family 2 protein n=1 Tax=Marisediminicola senii TaxID=2711233 RepID=UPI001F3C8D77|nr:glycosyltransferase family 2 protein [Marisediminicola senii]
MLQFVLIVVITVGINTLIWATVGLIRVLAAARARAAGVEVGPHPSPSDVAILIAAHNEEDVIAESIRSLGELSDGATILVVSDGSTDRTAEIARSLGAEVFELSPNRGKAGAIVAAVEHFDIAHRFEVLLLVDADTHLSPGYLESGLPQFADPEVVAVAGRATTLPTPRPTSLPGRILIAYRNRVYIAMQYLLKYGQAAKHANAVAIVPGFASMYRTRILGSINIAAQGLVIEDYNMTFEVHAKRLGRIAFNPGAAVALTQDPDTFRAYTKQVMRWNLGFWQTVKRHPFQRQTFWFALWLFIAELVLSSVVLVLLVPALLVSLGAATLVAIGADPTGTAQDITTALPPFALALGLLLPDFALTIMAAIVTRDARYLAWGLAFPALRFVDAAICLRTLLDAVVLRSAGTWQSPPRRKTETEVPVPVGMSGAALG